MKDKIQIEDKIKELEKQKESIAGISRMDIMKDQVQNLIEAVSFLDKQIALLNWVLTKP